MSLTHLYTDNVVLDIIVQRDANVAWAIMLTTSLLLATGLTLRPDLISPRVYVAFEGNSVTFTCTSEVEPEWERGSLFNEMPTYIDVYEKNDTLHTITIPNLKNSHTGQYICHGTFYDLYFKTVKFEAVANLYVGGEY